MTEQVKTFSSGAQSSSSKAGYWMIPFCVLNAVAKRFDLGALKYDAHNWKRGCEDGAFMRDRFNHMFEHLMKFKEGGDEEDDMEGSIIAVLINAVFLTYWTIMHRRAVEEAFPTEAPAVARRMDQTIVPSGLLPQTPLEYLKEHADKVVPESADPTPRRNAVAFQPLPREAYADSLGDKPIAVKPPKKVTNFHAVVAPATEPASPGQKVPLPQDTGGQQFC